VRRISTRISGSFVKLTFTCIQRVLVVPPIPQGALRSGNTLKVNCLNYQISTEKIEKIECIDCELVNTQKFLRIYYCDFNFRKFSNICFLVVCLLPLGQVEVCEANFHSTEWKFCATDLHLYPKGIGGAANTPGALLSGNTLEVNCLSYQICAKKLKKYLVCIFWSCQNTNFFWEFITLISILGKILLI
jgi:hypothetical protein